MIARTTRKVEVHSSKNANRSSRESEANIHYELRITNYEFQEILLSPLEKGVGDFLLLFSVFYSSLGLRIWLNQDLRDFRILGIMKFSFPTLGKGVGGFLLLFSVSYYLGIKNMAESGFTGF